MAAQLKTNMRADWFRKDVGMKIFYAINFIHCGQIMNYMFQYLFSQKWKQNWGHELCFKDEACEKLVLLWKIGACISAWSPEFLTKIIIKDESMEKKWIHYAANVSTKRNPARGIFNCHTDEQS